MLTEVRKQIKKEIEAEKFFGKPLVNVWINEEETEAGSLTLWEACIKQASDCDIFVSLLDGEAGWQKDNTGIGICQAEFETAYANSPGKVFGKPLVNVWINEEETEAGSLTLWEACIKQASDCDIFVSLLDGEAVGKRIIPLVYAKQSLKRLTLIHQEKYE